MNAVWVLNDAEVGGDGVADAIHGGDVLQAVVGVVDAVDAGEGPVGREVGGVAWDGFGGDGVDVGGHGLGVWGAAGAGGWVA